jgi:PAS domain S-box-containing protein
MAGLGLRKKENTKKREVVNYKSLASLTDVNTVQWKVKKVLKQKGYVILFYRIIRMRLNYFKLLYNQPIIKGSLVFMQDALPVTKSNLSHEQNFESLFMESTLPKIIFNYGGYKILNANNAALKLYGYKRQEFLKLNAIDIRANKSKTFMEKSTDRVYTAGKPLLQKSKHVTKKNKILSVTLNANILFYKGEMATLISITDGTGKKHLKEKIKKDKELLEKKILAAVHSVKENEKKLIANVLKENINQILAGTKMYLNVAKSNKEERIQLIEKSEQNIMEAMRAINQLYISYQET